MRFRRLLLPWIVAALACAVAVLARQYLIQPPPMADACPGTTLSLVTPGPWWCGVRNAVIMTYAWAWLFYGSIGLSIAALVWRRGWLGAATLAVGMLAIVWYTYEAGALAITIGSLVLARAQSDGPAAARR